MKIFNMMKTAKLLFGALLATVLLFASCAEEGLDDQTPSAVTTTAFTLTAETESAGGALAAEAPATRPASAATTRRATASSGNGATTSLPMHR